VTVRCWLGKSAQRCQRWLTGGLLRGIVEYTPAPGRLPSIPVVLQPRGLCTTDAADGR
jgi:hypothetical protein